MPQDPQKALAYLEQAAKQGTAQAHLTLAALYTKNFYNIPTDPEKVAYWSDQVRTIGIKAAQESIPFFQNWLAQAYENGSGGFSQDPQQAQQWREKAIDGFREEITFAEKHQSPLRLSSAFRLYSIYTSSPEAKNPLKAYIIASVILTSRFGLLKDMADSAYAMMTNDEQIENAEVLAAQCRKILTEICYQGQSNLKGTNLKRS